VKELIKIDKAVIVEGKYDKIHLENFIDALIIPTDGYRIFKDKEKLELIRILAKTKGILVLTDSDNAGKVIRAHLKQCVTEGEIINVYLPVLFGKEKRKVKQSAQGILGVEGTNGEIILEHLNKAGVFALETKEKQRKIETKDLYFWRLSGVEGANENRQDLLKHLNLPTNLTTPALIDYANCVYGYEDFEKQVIEWQDKKVKN
jgi:ribonuclease M5